MKSKSLIALLLSAVLTIGSTAVPVYAEDLDTIEDAEVITVTESEVGLPESEIEETAPKEEAETEIAKDAEESTISDEQSEENLEASDLFTKTVTTVSDSEEETDLTAEADETETELEADQKELVEQPVQEADSNESLMADDKGIADSGTCGDNVTWTLDEEGTLTISGEGPVTSTPWREDHKNDIKSVIVENGVTSLSTDAFEDCSELTDAFIASSVEMIGYYTFYNCPKLENVTLSLGIKTIAPAAFACCTALTSLDLPSSVTSIGWSVFSGSSSLKSIAIPEGVPVIHESLFAGCKSLETLYIPKSVTAVYDDAFEACNSLKDVYYNGSKEEWSAVRISSYYNEALGRATIHFKCDHSWNTEYTVDKEATCTEEGSESIHCSLCDAVDETTVRAIPKKDHSYGEWEIEKDAACTEPGSRKKTCTACGDEVTEEIPAKGHIWNEEYTIDKEPTDKEEGSKSIHCSVCNAVKEGSEVVIPVLVKDVGALAVNGIENKAYTGKEVKQDLVIMDGDYKLVENIDFTLTYFNNTTAGTASMNIKGIGKYTGEETITFTILPGKTTRGDMFNLANNVKVTWKEVPGAKYYKVYRSGVKDPVIVTTGLVGWDKEPGLVNGQKYTYKIVASLTGKGDSSGDSPLSYSKVMYRLKTVVIRSVKNTAPGKVTVKYDKTTSGDSYVLQYCDREDMVGAKTKVVLGANNTSYVLSGLKKGKTYYISIRVRKKVNGIDYYTTFGVPKKVKITQ